MPAWLIGLLLPMALRLVTNYGLPALEKKWPFLVPIVEQILAALGGTPPSPHLTVAADHFNALVGEAPSVKS